MSWLRHHDRYESGVLADANIPYWPGGCSLSAITIRTGSHRFMVLGWETWDHGRPKFLGRPRVRFSRTASYGSGLDLLSYENYLDILGKIDL